MISNITALSLATVLVSFSALAQTGGSTGSSSSTGTGADASAQEPSSAGGAVSGTTGVGAYGETMDNNNRDLREGGQQTYGLDQPGNRFGMNSNRLSQTSRTNGVNSLYGTNGWGRGGTNTLWPTSRTNSQSWIYSQTNNPGWSTNLPPTGTTNGVPRYGLPPGLQNRDQLPPGLERRDELPPGLQRNATNAPGSRF